MGIKSNLFLFELSAWVTAEAVLPDVHPTNLAECPAKLMSQDPMAG